MPQYSPIQSVFQLNMASNGASSIKASQADLTQFLEVYLNGGTNPDGYAYEGVLPILNSANPPGDLLQLWGAPWQVVWGPAVYLDPLKGSEGFATNAMYVAYSASEKAFVVAIAATNPASAYDWLLEDGNVSPHLAVPFIGVIATAAGSRRPWPGAASDAAAAAPHDAEIKLPDDAKVSAATALGLTNLLLKLSATATPPNKSGYPAAEVGIATFLKACAASDHSLYFTGHSLAGALSPSLAASLYPTASLFSGWQEISVLPTAGATPGNGSFAGWFNTVYPQQPADNTDPAWQPAWTPMWNTDTANGQDVVPHAWNRITQFIAQPTSGSDYPSQWGYLGAETGKLLYGAAQDAIKLATEDGKYPDFYQSVHYAFGWPPFAAMPSTAAPWPNPPWGHWQWNKDETSGAYLYPPVWTAMPQYTTQQPAALLDLGGLIDATHIDQYYPMFGIAPVPRMQHKRPSPPPCKFCRGAVPPA